MQNSHVEPSTLAYELPSLFGTLNNILFNDKNQDAKSSHICKLNHIFLKETT